MILRKTVTSIHDDSIQCGNITTMNTIEDIQVGDIAHITRQDDNSWIVIDYEPEQDGAEILQEKGYNIITIGLRNWNFSIITYHYVAEKLAPQIQNMGYNIRVHKETPTIRAIEFLDDDYLEFEKEVELIKECDSL